VHWLPAAWQCHAVFSALNMANLGEPNFVDGVCKTKLAAHKAQQSSRASSSGHASVGRLERKRRPRPPGSGAPPPEAAAAVGGPPVRYGSAPRLRATA
jgi:hypothetical protein